MKLHALCLMAVLLAPVLASGHSITIEGFAQLRADEASEGQGLYIIPTDARDSAVFLGDLFSISDEGTLFCISSSLDNQTEIRVTAPIIFSSDSFIVETPRLKCEATGQNAQASVPPAKEPYAKRGRVKIVSEAGMMFYSFVPSDGSPEVLLGAPFEMTELQDKCLSNAADSDHEIGISAQLIIYDDGSLGIEAESIDCHE